MTRAQIRTAIQTEPKIDVYIYFEGSNNSGSSWSQVPIEDYQFDQSIDTPVSSLSVTITDPTNIADYLDETSGTNVVRKGDMVRLSVGTGTGSNAIYKFQGIVYKKRTELVTPEGGGTPVARLMLDCYDPLIKYTEGYGLDPDRTSTLGANLTTAGDNTEYYAQLGTARPDFPDGGVVKIESEYCKYSDLVAPGHGLAGLDNTQWLLDLSKDADGSGDGRNWWGSTKAAHASTTTVTMAEPRGLPVWTQESTTATIQAATMTDTSIAFVDGGGGNDSITDSNNGFITAGFEVDMSFTISGSTSNDGTYVALSVAAGTIEIATGSLTAEVAGDTVTVAELTLYDGTIYKANSNGSLENYEYAYFPQFNNPNAYDLDDYTLDITADITASDYMIPAGTSDPRTFGYKPQGWAVLDDSSNTEAFFYYKIRSSGGTWYFYATQEEGAQQEYTNTTIAFVDGGGGNDSITDSASGFDTSAVSVGDLINISGSTSNDGTYAALSVAAGTIEVATGSLTAEIAGDTVTVTAWKPGRGAFGTTPTAFASATPTSIKQLRFRQMAASTYPNVMIELTDGGDDYQLVNSNGRTTDTDLNFPYKVFPRSGFIEFGVAVEDTGNNALRVAVKVDVYTEGSNDVLYDGAGGGILEKLLEGPLERGGAGFVDGDLDFTAAGVDIGYFRADQREGQAVRLFERLQESISPKNVFYLFDHINNKVLAKLFTQLASEDYDLDTSYRITDADMETTLEDMASGVRVYYRGYDAVNAAKTAYSPHGEWDSVSTGWYQRLTSDNKPPSGDWSPSNTVDNKQESKQEGFDLRYYNPGKGSGQPDESKFPVYAIYWELDTIKAVDGVILQMDKTEYGNYGNLIDPETMEGVFSLQGSKTFDPNDSGTGETDYGGGWFDISPKSTRFSVPTAKTDWTHILQLTAEDIVNPEMNALRLVCHATQQYDNETSTSGKQCKIRVFSIHVTGEDWKYVDKMLADASGTLDGDPWMPVATAAYDMWANWRNKMHVVFSESAFTREDADQEAWLWLNEKARDFPVLNVALEWDPTLQVGETYNVTIPQFGITDQKFFCQRITETAGKVRASLIDYSVDYWGV